MRLEEQDQLLASLRLNIKDQSALFQKRQREKQEEYMILKESLLSDVDNLSNRNFKLEQLMKLILGEDCNVDKKSDTTMENKLPELSIKRVGNEVTLSIDLLRNYLETTMVNEPK